MQLLETINYPCGTQRQISSAKQYLKEYDEELAKINILNTTQDHNYLSIVEQQILDYSNL